MISLKQLSADVRGIIKTLAEVGMRDNTIKRHLMKREQLCWSGEPFHLLDRQFYVWEIEDVSISLRNKACLVLVRFLATAACGCIALSDMRGTGLDCLHNFEWRRAQITWTIFFKSEPFFLFFKFVKRCVCVAALFFFITSCGSYFQLKEILWGIF